MQLSSSTCGRQALPNVRTRDSFWMVVQVSRRLHAGSLRLMASRSAWMCPRHQGYTTWMRADSSGEISLVVKSTYLRISGCVVGWGQSRHLNGAAARACQPH
jgi:hypothetical protein